MSPRAGATPHADLLFWSFLRGAREARALTLTEAARRIGVKPPTLYEWESGHGAVSEATMIKVAAGYGLTLRELLTEGLRRTAK